MSFLVELYVQGSIFFLAGASPCVNTVKIFKKKAKLQDHGHRVKMLVPVERPSQGILKRHIKALALTVQILLSQVKVLVRIKMTDRTKTI